MFFMGNCQWTKGTFLLGSTNSRAEIRVLIPGSGLGRIVYEVLRAGFEVQGNELEFCMLMASNLALNE
jgi:N2227-like protein